MDREVFILPTGTSSLVWDLQFGTTQQHVETTPATEQKSDGGTVRNGTAYATIETGQIKFCACHGSLEIGQTGQLSSAGDQFFDVTISAIEAAGDHAAVTGYASRTVEFRFEWDR